MILHLIEATTDDSKPWAFKKVNKSKNCPLDDLDDGNDDD